MNGFNPLQCDFLVLLYSEKPNAKAGSRQSKRGAGKNSERLKHIIINLNTQSDGGRAM